MEESKQNKIALLRQMVENAERNIAAAKQVLSQLDKSSKKSASDLEASQVIEGVFDGEKMAGLDDKKYPVPPNYASKSKLVEGDLLKLTITEDGSFVYKQISPVERKKIIGTVTKDSKNKYYIYSEGKKYKVLLASLTYFKAKEGDEVALIVPKEKISKWAAIEALLEKDSEEGIGDGANDIKTISSSGKEKRKTGEEEDAQEEDLRQESGKDEIIEDEWIPNIEEIKKEAQFDKSGSEGISDELLDKNE